MAELLAAVDVGTGSARAGIFDAEGVMLGRAEAPISILRSASGEATQNSGEIWGAVCRAVREALAAAGAGADDVRGIGFDATCSLVVLDATGQALSVTKGASPEWDTLLWMDHRAIAEAEECTATGHPAIAISGGAMSPEMQIPKLMWLKRALPQTWAQAGHFFDLADFLTWKSTGSLARSQCTLACKWSFGINGKAGWPEDFLSAVGLEGMPRQGQFPANATPPGLAVGTLTPAAAGDLGLTTRVQVGAGMIDAHAGALAVLGRFEGRPQALLSNIALVAGTSTCVMALTAGPRSIPGFWGPAPDAVLPGLWIIEGGQSASGALLDHLLESHARGGSPTPVLHARVADRILELRAAEGTRFAAGLHVLPDYHGNRSPLAAPRATGAISGLTLDDSFDGLCRLYWRSAVALALSVRQVLDAMPPPVPVTLHLAGGHTNSQLLPQLYADATGREVVTIAEGDEMLLGAAMLAATAAGIYAGLATAARSMRRPQVSVRPDVDASAALDRDYQVLLTMQRHRAELEAIGFGVA